MFETKTISDHIYETLKEEIINLVILPEQKLSEKSIASRFKVSCAPAKNAIHKLQRENLVKVIPQVGTIVASISYSKAADLFAIRLLLEPYAAKEAVLKIPQNEIDDLIEKHDLLVQEESEGTATHEIVNIFDKELHSILIRWSGNKKIEEILSNFSNEIRRIRLSTTDVVDSETANREQLESIYSAIVQRSPTSTAEFMKQHILCVRDSVLGALSEKDG